MSLMAFGSQVQHAQMDLRLKRSLLCLYYYPLLNGYNICLSGKEENI